MPLAVQINVGIQFCATADFSDPELRAKGDFDKTQCGTFRLVASNLKTLKKTVVKH